jgi:Fic family protein
VVRAVKLNSPPRHQDTKNQERLLDLWRQYRQRLQSVRSSALLLALVDELFMHPYITFGLAKSALDIIFRSAQLNVRKLVNAEILEEIPGRKYGRIFVAREIMAILEKPEAE